jgi:hypothetical protein
MGESTSVSSDTGSNVVVPPRVDAGSSAAPKRQPAGSVTLGCTVMRLA